MHQHWAVLHGAALLDEFWLSQWLDCVRNFGKPVNE